MNARVGQLTDQYLRALKTYCSEGGEAALLRAYQLGRAALADGLGVLEMAALHQDALVSTLIETLAAQDGARIAERASEFLAESLAPFELTRRGFQELTTTLSDLNRGLQHRLDAALQDIESARDQLLRQQRLEELKNEFICLVSHEVRTPVTSIHGAISLLQAGLGGELNEQGRQLVAVAHRNSQRLLRFVTDILDLQKIEAGTVTFDLRPIELASFLEQAVEANRGYASQFAVTLSLGSVPRDLSVFADVDRLMQVMANLISNAAKFSPSEQPVTIEARRRGQVVRVSVRDRGPGIPEDFRDRVFEKFAQDGRSSDRGGFGLGLSITKGIVERLGGRVGFETAAGQGTTFYVDLPEWQPERLTEPREEAWAGSR